MSALTTAPELEELAARVDALGRRQVIAALRDAGLSRDAVPDEDLDALVSPADGTTPEAAAAAWLAQRPGLIQRRPTIDEIAAASEAAVAGAKPHRIYTPQLRAQMRATYLAKQESRRG